MSVAALCPHPSVFASYSTFTNTTKVREGETAFQTVKRFRLSEKAKNDAGKNLWRGLKQCRERSLPEPKEDSLISLFGF